MHSSLFLSVRDVLMRKTQLRRRFHDIGLGMAGIMACVALPTQAGSVTVYAPQDGQVSMPVNWSISGGQGESDDISAKDSLQLVLRYLADGVGEARPEPGAKFNRPFRIDNQTLGMGFYSGTAANGHVLITLPALDCHIGNGNFKSRIPTMLYRSNISDFSSRMDISALSLPPYGWSSVGSAGIEVQSGIQSLNSDMKQAKVTTSLDGGQATVLVAAGATPGDYRLSLPVQCESYAATPGGAMERLHLVAAEVDVSVTVKAPLASCFVSPLPVVIFYPGKVNRSKVQLDTRKVNIGGYCNVSPRSEDIGKGMYLTFDAGSQGVYDGDNKKLATSNESIYITGGSDSNNASCANSNMQFDGLTHAEFKLKTLEEGINQTASKDIYFSLCHDTSKPLVTGKLHSDAKVNVVVQ